VKMLRTKEGGKRRGSLPKTSSGGWSEPDYGKGSPEPHGRGNILCGRRRHTREKSRESEVRTVEFSWREGDISQRKKRNDGTKMIDRLIGSDDESRLRKTSRTQKTRKKAV